MSAAQRASEASSLEQANERAVRANERADERMTQCSTHRFHIHFIHWGAFVRECVCDYVCVCYFSSSQLRYLALCVCMYVFVCARVCVCLCVFRHPSSSRLHYLVNLSFLSLYLSLSLCLSPPLLHSHFFLSLFLSTSPFIFR